MRGPLRVVIRDFTLTEKDLGSVFSVCMRSRRLSVEDNPDKAKAVDSYSSLDDMESQRFQSAGRMWEYWSENTDCME
jgi:hypothetical protein